MGVPKFARWLLYHSKQSVLRHGNIGYTINSVSIDLNGVLHKVFQKVYTENILDKSIYLVKEGNKLIEEGKLLKKKGLLLIKEGEELIKEGNALKAKYDQGIKLIELGNRLLDKGNQSGQYKIREGEAITNERIMMRRVGKSQDLLDKLERDYQEGVWQAIKDIIKEFGNIQTLILAVDGVNNDLKGRQQRQRRFKATLINNPLINFDSNIITPGTEFMLRLDTFLEEKIKSDRQSLPEKVIYSGCLTPGEGEHKLMEYFRLGEVTGNGYHIVYGLDADLIMLSLLSPLNNIILSRESQENMININEFKKYLHNVMGTKTAIQDFVIMMFLIGNDFLPHQLTLENMDVTINLMIDIYQKGNGKYSFSNGDQLNVPSLSLFLNELSKSEQKLLTEIAFKEDYVSEMLNSAKTSEGFDLNIYREGYYEKEFGQKYSIGVTKYEMNDTDIQNMVHDYVKTMAWTFLYYNTGDKGVNVEWLYKYYHSPMLVDLAIYSDVNVKGYKAYKYMTEFSPLHQLIAVLPTTSIHIVPDELKPLFSPFSPLADLFPHTFINDQQGKVIKKTGRPMVDHGIPIIPIVDRRRIIDILPLIEMSEERVKMWDEKTPTISVIKRNVPLNQYNVPGNKNTTYQKPAYQNTQKTYTQNYQQNYQPYNKSQQSYQPNQSYNQGYQQNYQNTQKPSYNQGYQQKYPQSYQPYNSNQQKLYQNTQFNTNAQEFIPKGQSQYTQKSSKQTYVPKTQTYVPKQTYEPKQKTEYVPKHETKNEKLPPMINLNTIQEYMTTGNIGKNAKEQLFEEDWNL